MQRQDFKKTDDMFNRVLGKDHIAIITLFENIHTGTRLVLANAHLSWDPAYRDVKLVQVALLVDEVEKIAHHFSKYPPPPPVLHNGPSTSAKESPLMNGVDEPSDAVSVEENEVAADGSSRQPPPNYSDGTKIPTIVCGDFNSVQGSGVYDFLSLGTVPAEHPDFMSHMYGRYTSDGIRHKLGLKNAYAPPVGDALLTNYTPTYQGVLDHVWFSAANLGVTKVLGEIDRGYLAKVVGFPNAHYPSEYVFCLFFRLCSSRLTGGLRFSPAATSLLPASYASSHSENRHPRGILRIPLFRSLRTQSHRGVYVLRNTC
jgi:CCR4-NOT transcription complex subunit 6